MFPQRPGTISLTVAFMISSAWGQGVNNLWLGGYESYLAPPPFGGSNIDFSSGVPDMYYQYRDIDIRITNANITNASGELLFFTNGVVVGTQYGDTMQNGTGLNPSIYTDWYPSGLFLYQANMIIPDPGDTDLYYLFHNTIDIMPDFVPHYLYLSVIDMGLDGGTGAVVSKNQVIYTGDVQPGHLTAVRHGNGRDWWVYAHEFDNNVFLRWLITPQGLSGPFSQSIGALRAPDPGQVVFSQNGERFAYFAGETGFDLFEVDRCDGTFNYEGFVFVDSATYGIGASFSPNGRFVYLSAQNNLYQVDGDAPDLQASLSLIATWDSTYSPGPPFATKFGASKLAPDGKIYISTMNGTDKLHVINQPDSLCPTCDVVQHGITLPTYWSNSLPNHPNYHLGALAGSICDSLGLGVVEQKPELNLSLYPNPNTGAFTLSFAPQPQAGALEVHDVNGKLVHKEAIAPWSQLKRLHLPLSSGIYQCRLRFGSTTAVRRFAVDR